MTKNEELKKQKIEQDPKLNQAWEELREAFKKSNEQIAKSFKSIKDDYNKRNKDYVELAQLSKDALKPTTEFMKFLKGENYADKAERASYYEGQREKLENSGLSSREIGFGKSMLKQDEEKEGKNASKKGLQEKVLNKAGNEISDELQNVLLGYKDFSEGMKSIGAEMSKYMLKQLTDTLIQMVFAKENTTALASGGKAFLKFGKGIFSSIGGFFGKLGKHHSGGIVPVGANAELPGTKEQLALLKGGERILSPSENASYNSNGGSGGSSPVVFNNFNIKAWDSKDVSKYLLENKQLLNSITYEGIKSNNNQLRNMVRNA